MLIHYQTKEELNMNEREFNELQEKYACDPSIVNGVIARIPPSWNLIIRKEGGAAFQRGNVQVIISVSYELDHKIWIHVSCSAFQGRIPCLPSWEDMKRVKHDFIGPERWAYQVFPSEKQYVNLNPNVLHLFALLEGEPALPDFTHGIKSI